ncbi:patatin-like phospholipase family protein [Nocardia sp. IFM 10818]
MSAAVPSNASRHTLVLGGGGAVGICWMAGLLTGLRDAGIDLALADTIIGTSAGAVVGAVLADDGDMSRLVVPAPGEAAPIAADQSGFMEILGILSTPGIEPVEARRRAGARTLEMDLGDPGDHIGRIRDLVGTDAWPRTELLVTSVSALTGELRVWTRADGVPLGAALAASTCVPGVFPPIPIEGDRYFDGGLRTSINADLAVGAEVIVVIEPLAHLFPRGARDTELGEAASLFVVPDAESIAAIGYDLFSSAAFQPAYDAAVRQAAEEAARVKAIWPVR